MKVLVLLLAVSAMLDLTLATPDIESMMFPDMDRQAETPPPGETAASPPTSAPTSSPTSAPTSAPDDGKKPQPAKDEKAKADVGEPPEKWAFEAESSLKCYVPGQCQEFSTDFVDSDNPDSCGHHCRKANKDKKKDDPARCNWWSWEPGQNLCIMFRSCSKGAKGDPQTPDQGPCPRCISGQGDCPARACYNTIKCKGVFIDSWSDSSLRQCISACATNEDCGYYTFEKTNKHCVLYEDCNKGTDEKWLECDTCFTGEKSCGLGFLGTTLSGYGFKGGANNHAYAMTKSFTKTMIDNCKNYKSATMLYDGKEKGNTCTMYGDCKTKQVFHCDPGYAFDGKFDGKCKNIREKAEKNEHIWCGSEKLESTIYLGSYAGSN